MAFARVEGIDTVSRNINTVLRGVKQRSMRGLLRAALQVRRLAQQRVPVEYGQLRASAFHRPTPRGAEVGFAAGYAVYVHENMQMKLRGKPRPSGLGVYWGPQGRPKFLESALMDLREEIVRIVAQDARVK